MSDKSAIEWTDATWNPVTGCTKISAGCKNCYAERFAERFRGVPNHPFEQGFDLRLWPERLTLPLVWKESRMIFVNSMSDLFHKDVSDDFIRRVFKVMTEAKQHVFQVLTKRPQRMLEWISAQQNFKVAPHIWLGVSVENDEVSWRMDFLKKIPAQVRFLSIEPLIGPVHLSHRKLEGIHWVIVGGESGPGARPVNPEWITAIRDECRRNKVPFFFKQWGAYNAEGERVGKKTAGRVLEGKEWSQLPGFRQTERRLVA